MNKQKSIKFNFIMNTFLTLSSFLFPLITFPYVSRILLPAGMGRVSFATSVVSYFALFAQLGIPTYGIRACAKVRDDRTELTRVVHELFVINLVMSIFAYVLLALAIFCVPRLRMEKTLILVISVTVIFNAVGMEWLYRALEQYTFITVRSLIFKVIGLVFLFLLVHEAEDVVIYGGITCFAASASSVANFLHVHHYIGMKPVGGYRFRRHFKAVLVFFAMSCATVIYTNLDTVMLGFMKTDEEVGYYHAAVKVKTILVSVVTSLGTVLLPRLSYYVEQGKKQEFERLAKKAMNFVVMLALPMMLYFTIFAGEGICFLSGSAYKNAVLPMQIIMPTLLFIGMTNVMGIQILVPAGKEKTVLVSEIAGAVTDLAANAVLIPKLASAGAAIGTLLAEFVVWLVQFFAVRHVVERTYEQVRWFYLFPALAAAGFSCVWVKSLSAGDFVKLVFSAVMFFGVYFLVLAAVKEPLVTELKNQMAAHIRSRGK